MFEIFVALLGFSLVASPVLTLRALVSCSWVLMWFAALASFVVSIIGMFSIGAFVFALTCLQLAAVFALRWHFSPPQWIASLVLALLIWVLLVPAQIYGYRWLGGIGAYQIVGVVALIVALLPWGAGPHPGPGPPPEPPPARGRSLPKRERVC
jgi:hypothetical protein